MVALNCWPFLANRANGVDRHNVGAPTLLRSEPFQTTRAQSRNVWYPTLIMKSRLPGGCYCCPAATGRRANGGNSQFGSTFRLCFSPFAGISHTYGIVPLGG